MSPPMSSSSISNISDRSCALVCASISNRPTITRPQESTPLTSAFSFSDSNILFSSSSIKPASPPVQSISKSQEQSQPHRLISQSQGLTSKPYPALTDLFVGLFDRPAWCMDSNDPNPVYFKWTPSKRRDDSALSSLGTETFERNEIMTPRTSSLKSASSQTEPGGLFNEDEGDDAHPLSPTTSHLLRVSENEKAIKRKPSSDYSKNLETTIEFEPQQLVTPEPTEFSSPEPNRHSDAAQELRKDDRRSRAKANRKDKGAESKGEHSDFSGSPRDQPSPLLEIPPDPDLCSGRLASIRSTWIKFLTTHRDRFTRLQPQYFDIENRLRVVAKGYVRRKWSRSLDQKALCNKWIDISGGGEDRLVQSFTLVLFDLVAFGTDGESKRTCFSQSNLLKELEQSRRHKLQNLWEETISLDDLIFDLKKIRNGATSTKTLLTPALARDLLERTGGIFLDPSYRHSRFITLFKFFQYILPEWTKLKSSDLELQFKIDRKVLIGVLDLVSTRGSLKHLDEGFDCVRMAWLEIAFKSFKKYVKAQAYGERKRPFSDDSVVRGRPYKRLRRR